MFKWITLLHYICRIWPYSEGLITVLCHFDAWSHYILTDDGSSQAMPEARRQNGVERGASLFVCSNMRAIVQHWRKGTQNNALTLQLDSWPSPPAHTICSVTRVLHQSGLLQVAWLTMGSIACCRASARGPPAGKRERMRDRKTNNIMIFGFIVDSWNNSGLFCRDE